MSMLENNIREMAMAVAMLEKRPEEGVTPIETSKPERLEFHHHHQLL